MRQQQLDRLKAELLDSSYEKPYEAVAEILKFSKLADELLEFILELEDKLVLVEFLKGYNNFSATQLDIIEEFIRKNLFDNDKLFASELIGIANDWGITSIYKSCIDFIRNKKEDHLIILESIYMIFEHLDLDFLEEVYEVLENIIASKEYYQSCQTASAFYLLRMSGQEKYFRNIIDYVENGQEMNRNILTNILSQEYNQQKYFSYHDLLMGVINKSSLV